MALPSSRNEPRRAHTLGPSRVSDGPGNGYDHQAAGLIGGRSQSVRYVPNYSSSSSNIVPPLPPPILPESLPYPPQSEYRPNPSPYTRTPSQSSAHSYPYPGPARNESDLTGAFDQMRLGGGYYNPNQSQASLPGPGAGAGGNHPYHQPYTASHAPSVYSLDSGVGAYNGRRASAETATATGDILAGDEYGADEFSGAVGELGLGPPPVGMNKSNPAVRALRTASSTSEISLHRTPTTSIGSSRAKRKGISAAIDVTKPPYTKEFVDDYRARMKLDPDPEAQFAFAKYLIEAARKVGEDMSQTDPKAGKRYRENLIAESLKVLKRLVSEGGVGIKGEGGYPEAQFFLANMFGTGQLGLQVDHEKAYQLYMQASKANHPAATYRTAVCNELGAGTRKEVNRAVLFYRKAAMLKDTAAMYKLAMILILGNMGQQINHREGVTWLRRAALQADEDNPHALHELAMIYEDPRSLKIHPSILPPSIDLARDHYTQAAQLGYAPSMHKLGVAYEHGHLGCPVDPKRSIAWLSRAAEKGDPEAALALSGWFLTGAEGVLKQDDAEAYLWARKAANKGLATAEYALAYYIEVGIGVKSDIELAKKWYQRAATSGSDQAKKRIEDLTKRKRPAGRSGGRPTRQEAKAEGCVIA